MPTDKPTQRHIHTVQTAASRSGPLTASEEAVLNRLLERKGESTAEGQARIEQQRREREKLERKRERLAAREQKKAMELRALQSDIDVITDQLTCDLNGPAKRDVIGRLDRFAVLTAQFMEKGMPPPPRAAIRAFAELVATPYLRPAGQRPLRQRLSDGGEN
jgi:hypothetical protein